MTRMKLSLKKCLKNFKFEVLLQPLKLFVHKGLKNKRRNKKEGQTERQEHKEGKKWLNVEKAHMSSGRT